VIAPNGIYPKSPVTADGRQDSVTRVGFREAKFERRVYGDQFAELTDKSRPSAVIAKAAPLRTFDLRDLPKAAAGPKLSTFLG
jgi:hypothetical protein